MSVEHYRKLESGAYGFQPEKLLVLYEKYKIDPTCLITGESSREFDLESFLANCSRDERDEFIGYMLAYMKNVSKFTPYVYLKECNKDFNSYTANCT